MTPFIVSSDAAKLLDFLKDAFSAVEIGRISDEHGRIGHAETRIGCPQKSPLLRSDALYSRTSRV